MREDGLILAQARLKMGETVAVNNAALEAQKLAYELERAEAVANMYQSLGHLSQDAREVAQAIKDLGQNLELIRNQALNFKEMQVSPATTTLPASQAAMPIEAKDTPHDTDVPGPSSTNQHIVATAKGVETNIAQQSSKTQHITCFVSLPLFNDDEDSFYKDVLLPALRKVLELQPYYWQVGHANDRYQEFQYGQNADLWLQHSHVYIADITELELDVIMELGYMRLTRKAGAQPLVLLRQKREDRRECCFKRHTLSNLDVLEIPYLYPNNNNKFAIEELAESLAGDFEKIADMRKLRDCKRAHYLSPIWLNEKSRIDIEVAKTISREYVTMEAIHQTRAEEIETRLARLNSNLSISLNSARSIKADVDGELKMLGGSQ